MWADGRGNPVFDHLSADSSNHKPRCSSYGWNVNASSVVFVLILQEMLIIPSFAFFPPVLFQNESCAVSLQDREIAGLGAQVAVAGVAAGPGQHWAQHSGCSKPSGFSS